MTGQQFSPDTGEPRNVRRAAILTELAESVQTMPAEDWAQHAMDVLKPLSDQDKVVMLAGLVYAKATT